MENSNNIKHNEELSIERLPEEVVSEVFEYLDTQGKLPQITSL